MAEQKTPQKRQLDETYTDGEPILDPRELDSRTKEVRGPVTKRHKQQVRSIAQKSSPEAADRSSPDKPRVGSRYPAHIQALERKAKRPSDDLKLSSGGSDSELVKRSRHRRSVSVDDEKEEVFPYTIGQPVKDPIDTDVFEVEHLVIAEPRVPIEGIRSTSNGTRTKRPVEQVGYDADIEAGLQALYFPINQVQLLYRPIGELAEYQGQQYERKCLRCSNPHHLLAKCPIVSRMSGDTSGQDHGIGRLPQHPPAVSSSEKIDQSGLFWDNRGASRNDLHDYDPFVHLSSGQLFSICCYRCYSRAHFGGDCDTVPISKSYSARSNTSISSVMSSRNYRSLITPASFNLQRPANGSAIGNPDQAGVIPTAKQFAQAKLEQRLTHERGLASNADEPLVRAKIKHHDGHRPTAKNFRVKGLSRSTETNQPGVAGERLPPKPAGLNQPNTERKNTDYVSPRGINVTRTKALVSPSGPNSLRKPTNKADGTSARVQGWTVDTTPRLQILNTAKGYVDRAAVTTGDSNRTGLKETNVKKTKTADGKPPIHGAGAHKPALQQNFGRRKRAGQGQKPSEQRKTEPTSPKKLSSRWWREAKAEKAKAASQSVG